MEYPALKQITIKFRRHKNGGKTFNLYRLSGWLRLTVKTEQGAVISVEGNTCKRGREYGEKEVTAPARTVTTTVTVTGGKIPAVSVRTRTDIPKEKIFDCIRALKGIQIPAPVHTGDIILADAAGTGVDVVATKTVELR